MQTVNDFHRLGYQIHDRVKLQRGRDAHWQADAPGLGKDAFLASSAGALHDLEDKTLDRAAAQEALATLKSGQTMLLGPADFRQTPQVTTFRVERSTQMQRGGPGGYPFYPERTVQVASRSLDDVAREMTGHPMATWAIRPQVGAYPDAPELYLFTPAGDGSPLKAEDVMTMLDGRRISEGSEGPGIQVQDGQVVIGSIRLDQKTYLIRLG